MLREFHGAAETPAHRTTVGGGWDGSGEGGEPGAEAASLQGRAARGRPGRGEGRGESVADFVPRNCDCKRGNRPGRINGVEAAIKDLVLRPVPSVTGSPLLPKRVHRLRTMRAPEGHHLQLRGKQAKAVEGPVRQQWTLDFYTVSVYRLQLIFAK